ncbi:uncharacterized protein BO80DRAFT_469679 [Aspergillus ibericus CBS 121593]|uniref:Uncharacterized protein n=1 Tax=Aspergillus ibericus CBS 121593 TaxID=1448316 RepID=A0A395GIB6_9EURO|nr:hypothetical protein BO80DRAFT_469679 [Aspergillus ibericus CBS 121593]RAK95084.1 hypothetical protein BO80DRAFT_469679 [Aspergillus ibericus CBS 121593]
MTPIVGRLPLRPKLIRGLLPSHGHHAVVYFSTRRALLLNKESSSRDAQGNKNEAKYWKYDFSFRTQMEKIVLIGALALIGSAGPWSWYRDIRHWWKGIPDDGDE